jgi:hypothetical protein
MTNYKTTRYKIGDKVRVRKNIRRIPYKGQVLITDEMVKMEGKEYVIKKIRTYSGIGYHTLPRIGGWTWVDEWLEFADSQMRFKGV